MNARLRDFEAARNKGAATGRPDVWELVWGQPYIDAARLARAIEQDLEHTPAPDFRTRLLVRDAARAMRSFWGTRRFDLWLAASPTGDKVKTILYEDLGKTGFPFIRRRLVASIGSTEIKQIFDLLGRKIHDRIEVAIAGSIPTLIQGMTARPTADIDFVNEVPLEIRRQRAVVKKIEDEYGLKLTHVQSHYLPTHWEQRRHFLGDYGGLRVYLVDEYDIFVSKLSSKREKHKQDIRVLARVLDKQIALRLLLTDGKVFLDEASIRPQIEENWRFIYQVPLPLPTESERKARGEGVSEESSKQAKGRIRTKGRKKSGDAPGLPQ
jgi:Nucleotidyltransferase of unknown function (DUF6036)